MNKLFGLLLLPFVPLILEAQETGKISPPYQNGEKIVFEMSYGFITGGKASIETLETTYYNIPIYYVKAVGWTIGMTDKLFGVYDVYQTWFDKETNLPYKASADIKENKYIRHYIDLYDQTNKKINTADNKVIPYTENTYDVLSAAFLLRKQLNTEKKIGDVIKFKTLFHGDPWDLVVRYKGNEMVKTKFGKIECMKFKPVVEKGTFEDQDALSIWISADKNHIPVLVQMEFFVGSFKTEIVEYSGLKEEIKWQKK